LKQKLMYFLTPLMLALFFMLITGNVHAVPLDPSEIVVAQHFTSTLKWVAGVGLAGGGTWVTVKCLVGRTYADGHYEGVKKIKTKKKTKR